MTVVTRSAEPVAQFTQRCPDCGSAKMWSNGNRFGCDDCGASFTTADGKAVNTLARRD
ncbi:MAG: hypothetical protein KBD06_02185 [Candidatus Pacebacteria bacterium]|nr:hypothetical protein [Candidatus Paceibacterota bacterium]